LAGRPCSAVRAGHPQRRRPDLPGRAPPRGQDPGLAGQQAGWERRSAGAGAHGKRLYDWTVLTLDSTGLPDGWGHWLLVRRQIPSQLNPTPAKEPELALYRCAGPATMPVPELIRVAGARRAIEECFQTAKNEAGLDHYQVRSWRAWYAHITLTMLAPPTSPRPEHRKQKRGIRRPAGSGGRPGGDAANTRPGQVTTDVAATDHHDPELPLQY